MERLSENAATFVRQLAQLADRLAAKDMVVRVLHADWSHFGCWELQVEKGGDAEQYAQTIRDGRKPYEALKGPEVLRVFWDGKDHVLLVDASPVRGFSAPNEWKKECEKGFDKADDDLLRFVENYLTKRFLA